MNDPWARPIGDPRSRVDDYPAVEIELDGEAAEHEPEHDGRDPNWRRVIAIATLAGIVLGIASAAVLLAQDDEPDSPEDVAVAPDDITAPPTLPPVAPVAPLTTGAADPPPSSSTAAPSDAAPGLPGFPAASLPGDILSRFVLDAETVRANTAARVTIEMESVERFGAAVVTVEHDSDNDRYLSIDGHVNLPWSQQILVDLPGDGVFLTSGPRDSEELRWERLDGADPPAVLAEQLRVLLHSPVRAETLAVARSVKGAGAVVLDDGTVAKRFEVVLPASALPEFGGGDDEDEDEDLLVEAFVDERGRLALVQLFVDVGTTPHLVRYRFDRGAEVTIEAPSVAPDPAADAGAAST